MAERDTQITTHHLAVHARRLVEIHGLTLEPVNDAKIMKVLKTPPSKHKLEFLKGGREKWGPDTTNDIYGYMEDHITDLVRDYPLIRAWWPTALSVLIRECDILLSPHYPWLEWYQAILGKPYPDFPAHCDWRSLIHEMWLYHSIDWRLEWEDKFAGKFPDAKEFDVLRVTKGEGNIWNHWRWAAILHGFGWVEGLWEVEALEKLDDAQRQETALSA